MVLVGAGGLGRELADVVQLLGLDLEGVVDDDPSETNLALLAGRGLRYLGTVDSWLVGSPPGGFVIGVANPLHRRTLDARMVAGGMTPVSIVHPQSTIGSGVHLGDGTVVCAGARLTTNIRTGRHAHVHVNATIGHDTTLGDFSSAYPQSAVSGSCTIASGATVGASATVIQGLTVGEDSFVGAGAVVTTDVPARTTVKGVPAR